MSLDALIAHRPPFRFVDEVVAIDASGGSFALELAPGDPRLQSGALPALLLIEALAQSTAAYHGARRAESGAGAEHGMLVAIDVARLFGCPRAGDRIDLRVAPGPALGSLVRFQGRAAVQGTLLAEVQLTVQRGEAAGHGRP